MTYFEADLLCQHSPEEIEEITKTLVMTSGNPAEIRSRFFSNASLVLHQSVLSASGR
jgi:hypothetical protein